MRILIAPLHPDPRQAELQINQVSDIDFKRNALLTTVTELKLMAVAANTGLSNRPNDGYKTPAATGIPTTL